MKGAGLINLPCLFSDHSGYAFKMCCMDKASLVTNLRCQSRRYYLEILLQVSGAHLGLIGGQFFCLLVIDYFLFNSNIKINCARK